ncbi:hypothetical protein [uncultured Tolumonas sp.]|uniref:hypothetical protein n=1 Tax=uncultured Tolumonas sp. TaxID=263765 RepID=UPI00292ED1E8|nr:hypothetical protein [uncultured Tolumonas sp.]
MRRFLFLLLLASLSAAALRWYLDGREPSVAEQARLERARAFGRLLKDGPEASGVQEPPVDPRVDDATRASIARMFEERRRKQKAAR